MITRLALLVRIEFCLWTFTAMPWQWRIAYALSRFWLLPLRGEVIWFGRRFASDNRLGLLLLPTYLSEVDYVMKFVKTLEDRRASESGSSPIRVVDVGANVGQFTVTLLGLRPDLRVIAFEPNPLVYTYLRHNCDHLRHQVFLRPRGVGPFQQTVNLFFVEGKSAQGSRFAPNASRNLVRTRRPREVTIEEGPINQADIDLVRDFSVSTVILKVDVEGYEISALEGMRNLDPDYLWLETIAERDGGLQARSALAEIAQAIGRSVFLVGSQRENSLYAVEKE